jgi:hypothetical protein
MKRHILFILNFLLSALHTQANPVTAEKAREKAAAFFNVQQTAGARRRAPAARQLRLAAQGRDDTYYIFNAPIDDGGFVVVSGDDATEEILGYSNSGTINPDDMPCGMKWLLDSYTDQIKFLRDNGITREQNSSSRRQANDNDSEEITTFRVDEKRLTSYYQSRTIDEEKKIKTGNPFNINLPTNDDGRELLTGCVATAMAGLMYAYQWPKKTIADIPPYTHTWLSPYGHVPGIRKGCIIDWSNIKQKYSPFIDKNDPSARAVATLLELAGYSVKTSYDYIGEGSGAWTKDVPSALINYFGYSDSAEFLERKDYPTKWCEMLRKELMENGPVLYCGYEGDGLLGVMWFEDSHAFLIEGFKGDKFYFNFGWGSGSSENTLFLIDLIDVPDHNYSWPYKQGAVFHVRPLRPEVEVTDLRFNNVNHTSPSLNVAGSRRAPEALSFNENKLSGSITFHNKGESKSWKFFFLQLRDVEAADTLNRAILKSLAPDETYTYNFSFNNLTIGHHYVLSSLDLFGDAFYSSTELLCAEGSTFADAEDDSGSKKLMRFEYWFDDDVGARQWATLTKSETVARGSINTDGLDDGFHCLNYRVQRDDGKYSSVSSSTFMKLTKEQENRLDYWLDDDLDNKQTLEIKSGEDEQLLELDLTGASIGFHRLNMQVALKGGLKSSVVSQCVMKLPNGFSTDLEYWFDDDIAHAKRLTGKRAEAGDPGFIFVKELDFSDVTPGHHRLYYRGRSSDGWVNTAICSTAIIMKSLYASKPKMDSYSIIVDDKTVDIGPLAPQEEVEFSYVLDTKEMELGEHQLKTTFWNSFGISVTEQMPFIVVDVSKIHGDVNGDGEVNAADIAEIISVMAGKGTIEGSPADVNDDGSVNVADIIKVISIIAETHRSRPFVFP